jgi:hypothetical protein
MVAGGCEIVGGKGQGRSGGGEFRAVGTVIVPGGRVAGMIGRQESKKRTGQRRSSTRTITSIRARRADKLASRVVDHRRVAVPQRSPAFTPTLLPLGLHSDTPSDPPSDPDVWPSSNSPVRVQNRLAGPFAGDWLVHDRWEVLSLFQRGVERRDGHDGAGRFDAARGPGVP